MVRRPEAIKRQRRPVYPVQGVFLAEIRGKDDPLSTLDVTKYFACLAVNPQSRQHRSAGVADDGIRGYENPYSFF